MRFELMLENQSDFESDTLTTRSRCHQFEFNFHFKQILYLKYNN